MKKIYGILAAFLALALTVVLRAEDGALINLVGRVDATTRALAVMAVTPGGADVNGAIGSLVGATDSTTRALKVYFDTAVAQVLGGNLTFSPDNTYDIGASGATRPRSIFAGTSIFAGSGGRLGFQSVGRIAPQSDGVWTLLNNAETDFTSLQFGGTSVAFPMLKRSANELQVRFANDSGSAFIRSNFIVSSGASLYTSATGSSAILIAGTAPTISSGFGTSPTIVNHNGTAAFTVNVGTGGTASSGVIGLPTATTGWVCNVYDFTAQNGAAAARADRGTIVTATATNSVTVTNITRSTGAALAWAASDVLHLSCMGY